jgi:hypothetical protein
MHLILNHVVSLTLNNYLNVYHNWTMLMLSINNILPLLLKFSLNVVLFEQTEIEKKGEKVNEKLNRTMRKISTYMIVQIGCTNFFGRTLVQPEIRCKI